MTYTTKPGSRMERFLAIVASHPDGVLVSTARAAAGMGRGGYDAQINAAERDGLIRIEGRAFAWREARAYPAQDTYEGVPDAPEWNPVQVRVNANKAAPLVKTGPASVFEWGR